MHSSKSKKITEFLEYF